MQITREQLQGVRASMERASARVRSMREKTEEVVGQAVAAAEVSGAAFGLGWVRGRYGEVSVVGVPLDIGLAAVLHTTAFLGGGGKYAEHLHSVGNGALAVYLTTLGAKIGAEMRQKAGGSTTLPSIPIKTGEELPAPGFASGWSYAPSYQQAMAASQYQGGLETHLA